MTPAELKAALKEAGLQQRAFAEMTGVIPLTVNRWCNGKQPIPKWVEALLTVMAASAASFRLCENLLDLCSELGLVEKIQERLGVSPLRSAISDRGLAVLRGSHPQTDDVPQT